MRSWNEIKGCVKAAAHPIMWAVWVNGTIFKGAYPVGATVCITPDGFVVLFIAEGTSK
jgi:hypothetical protein